MAESIRDGGVCLRWRSLLEMAKSWTVEWIEEFVLSSDRFCSFLCQKFESEYPGVVYLLLLGVLFCSGLVWSAFDDPARLTGDAVLIGGCKIMY